MSEFITITGFMGCGKSRVGAMLAERLGCRLIDLDRYIEEKCGRAIPEIFASEGEAAFRDMEEKALREILGKDGARRAIISLGGGTVTTPECASLVKSGTFCIYLRAGTDTLVKNLQHDFESRPMLGKPDGNDGLRARIEELMERRSAVYESVASLIIDIDGLSFESVADKIAAGCPFSQCRPGGRQNGCNRRKIL